MASADTITLLEELSGLKRKLAELEAKYQSLASPAGIASNEASSPLDKHNENKDKTAGTQTVGTGNGIGGETGERKPASRVKIINFKRNADGEPIETEGEVQKPPDSQEHAFTLKKTVYPKTTPGEDSGMSEIDVVNLGLWELLREHLGWYPYHVFRDAPTTVYSPYEPIVFEWERLQQAASQSPKDDKDKQAREDLKLLLDTISSGSSGDAKLDKYFKERRNRKPGADLIRYDDLWTVFPPGTLIYGKPFQGQDQVFVVRDNLWPWPTNRGAGEDQFWNLEVWSYDWKNTTFGRISFFLTFKKFDGLVPLTTLEYYPFQLHREYDAVWKRLVGRGKKFKSLCRAETRLFEYDGKAVLEKKGFSRLTQENNVDNHDSTEDVLSRTSTGLGPGSQIRNNEASQAKSTKVNDRVMVDFESYFRYGPNDGRNGALIPNDQSPNCACADCSNNVDLARRFRVGFDETAEAAEWDEEQYLICPPRVLGYTLRKKQWAQLQVDNIKAIAHDEKYDAWHSRLKLANEEHKKMLFDLVRSHSGESKDDEDEDEGNKLEVDDIVPGKGKGLVILLYGPPGVGKTTTAETIAVAANKPLLSVSVADVGTKAKHVESNLEIVFALATNWQAILLIDEADVFLESRGRGGVVQSTDKNALVSVFLRVLEYYQGIMVLTTNQIAEFDIAIPSRIHLAIQYPSLREEQMRGIFRGFLARLHRSDLVDDYGQIEDWLQEDVFQEGFDGRQIRNIVTTALGLARADKEYRGGSGRLTKAHMKKAFNNVKRFKTDFQTQMERYKESQGKMIK
ncbi:aaa family atpase [Apiospora aurea]|uniref:Aaa family atpase n=1 Tax=Apiospora aurea TaxID=335848 RepID=A0ABR1Q5L8_9PEZI